MDDHSSSMPILVIGLNHRVAPVEVRERLAFSSQRIPMILNELLNDNSAGISEAVLLSTCNRSECYVCAYDFNKAETHLLGLLTHFAGMDETGSLRSIVYILHGEEAVVHLMRVAAGLDSLIPGENEILGQVRCAAELAQSAGATGPILSALFRYAIRAGKRARSETEIGQIKLSVASVVVELAERTFGSLKERTALLIGAGKISSITARALTQAGLRCIMVANRTYDRAEKLAKSLNGTAVHFDCLEESLGQADIVICSAGAPHILLHYSTIDKAQQLRHGRLLLIADLAVPRDVDPNIIQIPGVALVNIDDLALVARSTHALAAPICQEVEAIIQDTLTVFCQWYSVRRCAPLIQALHHKAENICQAEIEQTLRRLGPLTPQQERLVQAMGRAIAGKLLHEPTIHLRELAESKDLAPYLELIQVLYGV